MCRIESAARFLYGITFPELALFSHFATACFRLSRPQSSTTAPPFLGEERRIGRKRKGSPNKTCLGLPSLVSRRPTVTRKRNNERKRECEIPLTALCRVAFNNKTRKLHGPWARTREISWPLFTDQAPADYLTAGTAGLTQFGLNSNDRLFPRKDAYSMPFHLLKSPRAFFILFTLIDIAFWLTRVVHSHSYEEWARGFWKEKSFFPRLAEATRS